MRRSLRPWMLPASTAFLIAVALAFFWFHPFRSSQPEVRAAEPAVSLPDQPFDFPVVSFAAAIQAAPPLPDFFRLRQASLRLQTPALRLDFWARTLQSLEDKDDALSRGLVRLQLGREQAQDDPGAALASLLHPDVLRGTALRDIAIAEAVRILRANQLLMPDSLPKLEVCPPLDDEARFRLVRFLCDRQETQPAQKIAGAPAALPKDASAWDRLAVACSSFAAGDRKAARALLLSVLRDASISASCWNAATEMAQSLAGRHGFASLLGDEGLRQTGSALVKSGNFRRAWLCFSPCLKTRAFQKAPAEVRLAAAWAALRSGESAEGLRLLEKTATRSARDAADRLCLMALCANKLRKEDLFDSLTARAETDATKSPLYLSVARTAGFQAELDGDLDKVLHFNRYVAENGDTAEVRAEALWKQAWAEYARGRFDAADPLFQKSCEADPGKEFGMGGAFWHGVCALKRGDTREARAVFDAVPAVFPYSYYAELARERAKTLPGASPSADRVRHWVACLRNKYFPPASPALGAWLAALPKNEKDYLLQAWASGYEESAAARLLGCAGDTGPRDVHALLYDIYRQKGDTFLTIRHFNRAWPEASGKPMEALDRKVWEGLFPNRYLDLVEAETAAAGIDPLLILGLIRQESAFRADVRSVSNAIGLMQLLPVTAAHQARWRGPRAALETRLEEPAFNIQLGCAYFAGVLREQGGRIPLALGGYNGGPSRMTRVMSLWGGQLDMAEIVEMIPMAESRNYVKYIFRNYNYYSRLYRNSPASVAAFLDSRNPD